MPDKRNARYRAVFTPAGWQVIDTVGARDPVAQFGLGTDEYQRAKNEAARLFSARDVPVEKGMVLLIKEPASDALPERYKLWSVKSIAKLRKGVKVTLLGWSPGMLMEATATFPDGLVADPWHVFSLSQPDLKLVYKRGEEGK